MKVVILGAGVVGVAAAYLLGERGHQVEVIERNPEAASETSFANGGQLSFSHAEPWANPMVLSKVFKWMFQKDAPLVMRFSADPHMMLWSLSFLRNCLKDRCDANSLTLLRLGIYSKGMMEKIRVMSGIEFDNLREGILHTYSSASDMHHAAAQAEFQNKMSGDSQTMQVLDREGCIRKEPTLAHSSRPLAGGVFCSIDESGDICTFTRRLAAICEKEFGATFHYNSDIQYIDTQGERIAGVKTNKGMVTGDVYMMAMGSFSYLALKRIGVRVPIYPMKGYSITAPLPDVHAGPTVSITDNENKIVISRLGNRLRAAGTAEFAGYNMDVREARVAPIVRVTKSWFPRADYSDGAMTKWACLRPSTPDGPPILGPTKYKNLVMNTGHGTLGWTQAAGSAKILADIIDGRPTDIALTGLTIDRY